MHSCTWNRSYNEKGLFLHAAGMEIQYRQNKISRFSFQQLIDVPLHHALPDFICSRQEHITHIVKIATIAVLYEPEKGSRLK